MTPKFRGKIYHGRFFPENVEVHDSYLEGLEGKVVDACYLKPHDSKTHRQLAYIHGVVFRVASEASGYTKQEVKALLKDQFLSKYITSKKTGKEIKIIRSLEDLSKGEMREFIDNCIMLIAREWGAVVPSPEEINYD